VIGANSVVTRDVPDFSVAVGNPAKVIKKYNFKNKKWEAQQKGCWLGEEEIKRKDWWRFWK